MRVGVCNFMDDYCTLLQIKKNGDDCKLQWIISIEIQNKKCLDEWENEGYCLSNIQLTNHLQTLSYCAVVIYSFFCHVWHSFVVHLCSFCQNYQVVTILRSSKITKRLWYFKGSWPYFGPDLIHYVFYSIQKGIIRTV